MWIRTGSNRKERCPGYKEDGAESSIPYPLSSDGHRSCMWMDIVMEKKNTFPTDKRQLSFHRLWVDYVDHPTVDICCDGLTMRKVVYMRDSTCGPLYRYQKLLGLKIWFCCFSLTPLPRLPWMIVLNPLLITGHNSVDEWFILIVGEQARTDVQSQQFIHF